MSGITSHVLDLSRGRPADDIGVTLSRLETDGTSIRMGSGRTDSDGRVADLLDGDLTAGTYRLSFETGAYFASRDTSCLHPSVEITITVTDPGEHHHVPLLLSPYGYSTYRGS